MGTARNMFPSKDKRDLTKPILREDLIQYDDLNTTGGGGSGVTQIIAGTNISINPIGGTGAVTINAAPAGTGPTGAPGPTGATGPTGAPGTPGGGAGDFNAVIAGMIF